MKLRWAPLAVETRILVHVLGSMYRAARYWPDCESIKDPLTGAGTGFSIGILNQTDLYSDSLHAPVWP